MSEETIEPVVITKRYGTPYSLREAQLVHATQLDYLDIYHKHLFGWLIERAKRLESLEK
jgi:hypothetical protein